MRSPRRILILIAIVAACSIPSGAQAANVTLGSSLVGFFAPNPICGNAPCTLVQDALSGATLRSPVDGLVVRWSLVGGDPFHGYKLRVLQPAGGLELTGAGTSAEVKPMGAGKETFPTALPIKAGQAVGINLIPGVAPGATIGERLAGSPSASIFKPILPDGQTGGPDESHAAELGFNAEVQPAPRIAAVTPGAGVLRGGNSVTIAGTDLEGASAVAFGGVPAIGYRVDSEAQITAVAPAAARPGKVPVSVTTLAGTATSAASYEYLAQPCVVPRLRGTKLTAAKRKLTKAHCRLGKVKATKGATARSGKVVGQKPRPGKTLPPGTKVNLTLA